MSDDKTAGTTNLVKLKDKLVEEFEKLSQVLRDEKAQFNEEMTRRRKELDSEIKGKLTELSTGKEAQEEANRQLQKKREGYTKELEKKNQDLKQMKAELERDKNLYLKAKEEQGMILSKETTNIQELKIKSQELQKENSELAQQKITLENNLKNLNEVLKKEEGVHFQKMAVLKSELEELEDEIEQKVFFAPDQAKFDRTKKSRELIIKTILGDTYRGNINIGSKGRLSDMFTKVKSPFIVMYDVIFKGEENTTIILNKQNIVSIEPLDKHAGNHFCKEDDKKN
ncbi:MAG: hypothetical protein U9N63_07800 [Pseudomonadota bacterium]|nr:hypothetical protein [Pseudomonadota bacterium]